MKKQSNNYLGIPIKLKTYHNTNEAFLNIKLIKTYFKYFICSKCSQ